MLIQGVASAQGFYGGFNVRPKNVDPAMAVLEERALAWIKPSGDEPSQQAMVYGGYRLGRDVGVEAALTHSQRLGLRFDPSSFGFAPGDPTAKSWNVDLYTSWALQPRFSVYGRLGYEQPAQAGLNAATGPLDNLGRRQMTGLNYGLGLKYDLNPGMGVRFEWARPHRNATGANGISDLPRTYDPDQVTVGVQFRF
jgi:opacity protein-like surface antigen